MLVLAETPTTLLRNRHDGMGRCACHHFTGFQSLAGVEVSIGLIQEVASCLFVFKIVHHATGERPYIATILSTNSLASS